MASPSEATPLLRALKAPPMFTQKGVEKMAEPAHFQSEVKFVPSPFTSAIVRGQQRMPQAIAHRGYKAKFPENTLGAFKGAVGVGAHAIETDIHITKDNVVVLSHDATLARCFGKPEKIIDCDWNYISTLRTLAEPHQYMPRLVDLLEYLAQPGMEKVWLLLDIKLDNDSDDVMRLIAKTLESVTPSSSPWKERVLLGCWAVKYLPLAQRYLPGYAISHIGFSTAYARQFFKVPNVSFNMLIQILQGPGGKKFIKDVQAQDRPIFAWTINTEPRMEWCIRRGLDGVITDDPKKFLEVCHRYDEARPEPRVPILLLLDAFRVWLFALIMGTLYRRKFDRLEARSRAAARR